MYGEVVRATSRVVIFLFLSVISEQRHSYRRFVFSVWPLIVSDFHFDFDILHKCFPLIQVISSLQKSKSIIFQKVFMLITDQNIPDGLVIFDETLFIVHQNSANEVPSLCFLLLPQGVLSRKKPRYPDTTVT
jgi:hypothetical protein